MIMIETCTVFNLCALYRNFQLRQRSMVHLALMWQLPLKMGVNAQQVTLKKVTKEQNEERYQASKEGTQ